MTGVAPLVLLFHGVRATGIDMNWLAGALSQHLPGAVFAQPDAPFVEDREGVGRQWFSLRDVTPENRPARVAVARAPFDEIVTAVLARHGQLPDDLSRVAFVGFSQGAIMVLDAVASGRWPVPAAVAISGRLALSDPLRVVATQVLLIHGQDDAAVPPAESAGAARRLRAAGNMARLRLFPNLGHTISAAGAGTAGRFLRRSLPAR
jgi:phospholipase/carboxylesterase